MWCQVIPTCSLAGSRITDNPVSETVSPQEQRSETTDLQFGRWGELFEQLASPQFWEYQASQRQWTVEQPQGEVQSENPSQNEIQLDTGASKAKETSQRQTRYRRVAGRVVRQPCREKLDFISLRQAKRLANRTDTPMYLGIIRGIDDFDMQLKQRQKQKPRDQDPSWLSTHGMTEGEKRRIMKETGPVTKEIPAETVIETHLQKADPAVRAPLRGIFDDYTDLSPQSFPMGRLPRGNWTTRFIWSQEKSRRTKAHTGSAVQRWRNCDVRLRYCLSRVGSGLVQALSARLSFSFQRKAGNGACVSTTGL